MNSLLQDFRQASARERLAIISDLFSIVGISAAAVVAPVFVGWSSVPAEAAIVLSFWGLALIGGFVLLLVGVLTFNSWLRSRFATESMVASLLAFSVWIFFVATFVLSFGLCLLTLKDLRF